MVPAQQTEAWFGKRISFGGQKQQFYCYLNAVLMGETKGTALNGSIETSVLDLFSAPWNNS